MTEQGCLLTTASKCLPYSSNNLTKDNDFIMQKLRIILYLGICFPASKFHKNKWKIVLCYFCGQRLGAAQVKKAVLPTSKWIVSDCPPQCFGNEAWKKKKERCNSRHNSLQSVNSWYLCVSHPRFKNYAPSKLEMLKLQPSTLLHWQWKKNLGLSKCNTIQSTAVWKLSCDKTNWKVTAKQYLNRSQPSELYLCLARTNLQRYSTKSPMPWPNHQAPASNHHIFHELNPGDEQSLKPSMTAWLQGSS